MVVWHVERGHLMARRELILSPFAAKEGPNLRRLAIDEWPAEWYRAKHPPVEAWISRAFLAQLFRDRGGVRITVNRTTFDTERGSFVDGITWDELQDIKRQVGRGDAWAVEVYPPDDEVVNDANMRHLWLLDEPPSYGWNAGHR